MAERIVAHAKAKDNRKSNVGRAMLAVRDRAFIYLLVW
jgi:hypothetical protein